jgi:pyocin large subunit-like protein
MPLLTNGFESIEQRKLHFRKHGDDFRASNPDDYEQMADIFLAGDKREGVYECARACGAIIRYDPSSEAFGVLDANAFIRTYFKPIPCSEIPYHERESARQSGRCHTSLNNIAYFRSECSK